MYLGTPVDGGYHPRQSKSKEDVHRVGPGDVSDRVVGRAVHRGRLLAGKQVREAGPEGDKRDGGDGVLEADETAEDGGEVADDGREKTDDGERDEEADPAVEDRRRRHERKHELREKNEQSGNRN